MTSQLESNLIGPRRRFDVPRKSLDRMKTLVGETVPTVTDLMVEAGKVAEFAASLRDESQLYRDEEVARAAGYERIPAPLTFTRVGYFPRYRPKGVGRDLGFDLGFVPERVVHGSQSYQFERQFFVGDTVRTTALRRRYSSRVDHPRRRIPAGTIRRGSPDVRGTGDRVQDDRRRTGRHDDEHPYRNRRIEQWGRGETNRRRRSEYHSRLPE